MTVDEGQDLSSIRIAAQGPESAEEAEALAGFLRNHNVSVDMDVRDTGADRMGTPEILLTIMITSASKAVFHTTLVYLEQYLRKRALDDKASANVQIALQNPEMEKKERLMINLRALSEDTIAEFIKRLREAVERL